MGRLKPSIGDPDYMKIRVNWKSSGPDAPKQITGFSIRQNTKLGAWSTQNHINFRQRTSFRSRKRKYVWMEFMNFKDTIGDASVAKQLSTLVDRKLYIGRTNPSITDYKYSKSGPISRKNAKELAGPFFKFLDDCKYLYDDTEYTGEGTTSKDNQTYYQKLAKLL